MIRILTRAAVLAAVLMALTPATLAAEQPVNLTQSFLTAGASVDRLEVYQIADIVIIRGRTENKANAEAAGRIAQSLGHTRVANLIQIVENNDVQIARAAERELSVNRSLDGCRFQVTAEDGVIRVAGSVTHELQKDVTMQVLRSIDGVRDIEVNLTKF